MRLFKDFNKPANVTWGLNVSSLLPPSKHTHLLYAKGGRGPTWLKETTYNKTDLIS